MQGPPALGLDSGLGQGLKSDFAAVLADGTARSPGQVEHQFGTWRSTS